MEGKQGEKKKIQNNLNRACAITLYSFSKNNNLACPEIYEMLNNVNINFFICTFGKGEMKTVKSGELESTVPI